MQILSPHQVHVGLMILNSTRGQWQAKSPEKRDKRDIFYVSKCRVCPLPVPSCAIKNHQFSMNLMRNKYPKPLSE